MRLSLLIMLIMSGCVISKNSTYKSDGTENSSLIGSWKTTCQAGASESYLLTVTFRENKRATFREEYFYGTTCTTRDTEWISEFDFSEIDNQIGFSRYHVKMTAQHSDTVDSYNTSGNEWCGIGNWVLDVQKSVTGLDCDAYPTDSETFYTTFTINSDKLEIFGSDILEDAEYIKQ